MDFFAQQDHARRKTKKLFVYFVLAVISMIVMIYGVAVFVVFYVGLKHSHNYYAAQAPVTLWNPELLAEVTLGTLAVIFCGSAYKTMALSSGGSAVAESLGGRLIDSNSNQPDERKLLNVVEEMSIASGVPMPQVYVMDQEDGINAFAAGHSTSDAAIAVTRKCMTQLSRDELQGVIGHEFSHILNGDMKLNLRLVGVLFGIFCIATIGRILLYTRSNSRDKNPLPLIGILLLIIGGLGLFFGRLIQAAVSRQREFLADASSVQFTRNPAGLSGALQKLGGFGSQMESPHASDASHMFFGNALTNSFMDAMATHPPLEERIRAIDPNWDGKFKQVTEGATDDRVEQLFKRAKPRSGPPIFNSPLAGILVAAGSEAPPPLPTDTGLRPPVNAPPLQLKYADPARDVLPDDLRQAAREPQAAMALVYAMLLSDDAAQRSTQLSGLAGRAPQNVLDKINELYPAVSQAATRARLPLVNLTLPALRQLDAGQFSQFSQTLEWFIGSDGRVELFEFVLQKMVLRHLAPKFGVARPTAIQFYTLKPLVPDCAVILSALAYVGSSDAGEIQRAFAAGAPFLRAPEDSGLLLAPAGQCGVEQVSAALDRLALAVPVIKKNLLDAAAHVIGADGVILENEAELLRAVADTLDCPVPPLGVAEQL
ncbi:MAG TPA: M48 family metallopeptidase [Verrucomicrobiae bacterium]|nr:M48 family metallopeptidase [Verrucomicrobiae bacterium]